MALIKAHSADTRTGSVLYGGGGGGGTLDRQGRNDRPHCHSEWMEVSPVISKVIITVLARLDCAHTEQ